MPLKTYTTQADYAADYHVMAPSGAWVHYERSGLYAWMERQVQNLVAQRNWPSNSRILIVGCGFGWGLEVFRANGFLSTWGTDTSPYIQASKAGQSPIPERILSADVLTQAGRNAVRQATGVGNAWHVILTEDVLPCYSDSECVSLANACRGMLANNGQLVHVVSTTDQGVAIQPPFNAKTLEAWKVLLPQDMIVRAGGEVSL